ncbi:MAG: caspase family protein [Planctomycetaceae bacterium]
MNRFLLVMFSCLLLAQSQTRAQSEIELDQQSEIQSRGRTPLVDSGSDGIGYRRKWALIIGINYSDGARTAQERLILPVLNNAESDAAALKSLLISHYGYKPEHIVSNSSGAEATYQWIQDCLRKLCDPSQVSPDDSVLVFFAGHGDRLESTRDSGALFPSDVRFSDKRPLPNTYLRVHSDLADVLEKSPARHKLIILDSCYSGEIFNVGAHPRSESDDRGSLALARTHCVQALTSCRSTQVASDGQGKNSPFTKGLLEALRQLPARHSSATRVWTNWLFSYLRPSLTLPNGQCPDCRNLQGDGEFGFFPDRTRDWSAELPNALDYQLLQVSAGSEQGKWWFEETPWFLPSVRQRILESLEPSRSGIADLRMDRDRIKDGARTWLEKSRLAGVSRGGDAKTESLHALRQKHLGLLLQGTRQPTLDAALDSIIADLTAPEVADVLEPEDCHLLAVVQHHRGLPEAEQTYLRVLDAYAGANRASSLSPAQNPDSEHEAGNALLALCKADFGEYLLTNPSQHFGVDAKRMAARYFREAATECRWQGPASFSIFINCREADAWLSLNRWKNADLCQLTALDLARGIGPDHYLTAFVHRSRAWSQMTKWEISEAEKSFRESNRILANWMETNETDSSDDEVTINSERTSDTALTINDSIRNSADHQARIAYFHNIHGLAMAQRFRSECEAAKRKYRALAMELEHALGQVRRRRENDSQVEMELLQRLINTLERLADCNLFGDPETRELSEALDDYDRANARIHLLPVQQRRVWQSKLSWKQALALALPSPHQDTQLALALTREADRLFAERKVGSGGLEQALGELTTPMVELLAEDASRSQSDRLDRPDALTTARENLRSTLLSYRDVIGDNVHRDQLELCLFASDLLVQFGQESSSLLALQDTDLLLSFCRIPLAPYRHSFAREPAVSEARLYLQPYFDTAMTSLLNSDRQPTKKLLRLQWESTRGSVCPKDEVQHPVVAVHLINSEPYLMYSLPHGPSAVLPLKDGFSVDEIAAACQKEDTSLLPLPRIAEQEFKAWRLAQQDPEQQSVEIRLCPEVVQTPNRDHELNMSPEGKTITTSKPTRVRFPFALPPGFTVQVVDGVY